MSSHFDNRGGEINSICRDVKDVCNVKRGSPRLKTNALSSKTTFFPHSLPHKFTELPVSR